jgi:hypothetical protein
MRVFRTLLLTLATGYILMFYSELIFWARPRPEDSLAGWLGTWLAYSLAGYVFLAAIRFFHVRDPWTLFLCGALFGWLTEGVIVQTMYAVFPLQISWTGLAWHALISVWFGWHRLRLDLKSGSLRSILRDSLGLGLFWGIWGIFWWYEEPETITTTGSFAGYALVSSLLLLLAYASFNRLGPAHFQPSKPGMLLAIPAFAVLFVLGIPSTPISLAVFPPLLAILLVPLARHRKLTHEGSYLDVVENHPRRIPSYLGLLLAPLTAILVYESASLLPWQLPTGWAVYAVTMPAGFILLVLSLVKIWKQKPATMNGIDP